MTMIAFTTDTDRAEIVTDSLAYTEGLRHLGYRPQKGRHFPAVNMTVLGAGNTSFLEMWHHVLEGVIDDNRPDDLLGGAQELLQFVHGHHGEIVGRGHHTIANIFHVGYSPTEGRFVAYGYSSVDGFAPVRIDGLHMQPAPLEHRPGPFEEALSRQMFDEEFDTTEPVDTWMAQPSLGWTPKSRKGWARLARQLRTSRALISYETWFKCPVGGTVTRTTLHRDAAPTVETVLEFDDLGDEFRQMIHGTLHPLAQAGPCVCGSGRRCRDCCMTHLAGQPCRCGSGQPFELCCDVDAPPKPDACPCGEDNSCCTVDARLAAEAPLNV